MNFSYQLDRKNVSMRSVIDNAADFGSERVEHGVLKQDLARVGRHRER